MLDYFAAMQTASTLEELKAAFHAAAKAFHPDNGGDNETMARLIAQYKELFPGLKNIHRNKDGETYEKDTEEAADDFPVLIRQLFNYSGLVIEILGSFIWISGNTREHKDALKALGFRWSKDKAMWYKAPAGYRRYGKDKWTIGEIRANYRNNGRFNSDNEKGIPLLAG